MSLGRWRALLRYSEDGTIEIDNNAAEAGVACRCPGTEELSVCGIWIPVANVAAAIYSLIGTAKLNGIDPEAYLRVVLQKTLPNIGSVGSPTSCLWNLATRLQPISA